MLGSTSTTRKPSNYRVVEVTKPIEELFPMVRYEVDLSESIELPSGRSGKAYRRALPDSSMRYLSDKILRHKGILKF